MNNEGVSSLPVLDAQNNVIGNISHVDVRVRSAQRHGGSPTNIHSVAHQVDITSSASILLYPLHFRNPL